MSASSSWIGRLVLGALVVGCGSRTGLLEATFGAEQDVPSGVGAGGALMTAANGGMSAGGGLGTGGAFGGGREAGVGGGGASSVGGKSTAGGVSGLGGVGGVSSVGGKFAAGGELGLAGEAMAGAAGAVEVPCPPGSVQGAAGCVAVQPPRLVAPLSTASATARRPRLHYELAAGTDGAHIEVCDDRACEKPLVAFDASGSSGVPASDLPHGVVFWRAFGKSGGVIGVVASATWEVNIGARSAGVDSSWGSTLDVNGDGFSDAIIGAPDLGENSPQAVPPGAGHAYLFMGGAQGLAGTPALGLVGPDGTGGRFGWSVQTAGDVNGDGFADVIVGAPAAGTFTGHAYVFLGGPGGLAKSAAVTLTGSSDSHAMFGTTVANAGDVNGDGYADVIVGAPLERVGPAFEQFVGRAYIFFGGPTGVSATPAVTLSAPESIGNSYGSIAQSAGDVNGDGFADLVISAKPYVMINPGAYQAAPAFYVYLGGPKGPGAAPDWELPNQNWMFSSVASECDLDGDGYADLAVGTADPSSAAIYLGSSAGVAPSPASTLGPQYGSGGYNYRLFRGGDVNGDGFQDLLASYDQIFAYSGSKAGLVDAPATFTAGAESPTIYGYLIGQVGDFNRDGYSDVIVGARFYDRFTGRAYVYLGSPSGYGATPAVILPGPDDRGGEFG